MNYNTPGKNGIYDFHIRTSSLNLIPTPWPPCPSMPNGLLVIARDSVAPIIFNHLFQTPSLPISLCLNPPCPSSKVQLDGSLLHKAVLSSP